MIDVYRHLRMKAWSIRERGRLVGHLTTVVLRDVRLIVQPSGVARVRGRGQREVVAYARGEICGGRRPVEDRRVRFDPFTMDAFDVGGVPLAAARAVFFEEDGTCWAEL